MISKFGIDASLSWSYQITNDMNPNGMSVSPNGETVILADLAGSVLLLNGTTGGFKYGFAKTGFKVSHTSFNSDSTRALISGYVDTASK